MDLADKHIFDGLDRKVDELEKQVECATQQWRDHIAVSRSTSQDPPSSRLSGTDHLGLIQALGSLEQQMDALNMRNAALWARGSKSLSYLLLSDLLGDEGTGKRSTETASSLLRRARFVAWVALLTHGIELRVTEDLLTKAYVKARAFAKTVHQQIDQARVTPDPYLPIAASTCERMVITLQWSISKFGIGTTRQRIVEEFFEPVERTRDVADIAGDNDTDGENNAMTTMEDADDSCGRGDDEDGMSIDDGRSGRGTSDGSDGEAELEDAQETAGDGEVDWAWKATQTRIMNFFWPL